MREKDVIALGILGALIICAGVLIVFQIANMNDKLDQIIRQTCTHGTSSVTATFSNGKINVSKPHTTGCVGR